MKWNTKAALLINGGFFGGLLLYVLSGALQLFGAEIWFFLMVISLIALTVSVLCSIIHTVQNVFELFVRKKTSGPEWNVLATVPLILSLTYLLLNSEFWNLLRLEFS